MGNYALIIVAAFVVVGGLIGAGMRSNSQAGSSEVAQVQYKEEARDAALAGLNLTMRRVVRDLGLWLNPNDYAMAETDYYRARFQTSVVTSTGDTLDITAVGTKDILTTAGNPDDTTHTIQVKIVRGQLADGYPEGFSYAILTDRDFDIAGTFSVTSLSPNLNADIHANGMLRTRSNTFTVEGNGSYTNLGRVRHGENFTPNVDLNGADPNYYQADSVSIPPIEIDGWRTDSQTYGVYNAGDVTVDLASLGYTSFADWAADVGAPAGTGSTPGQPFVFYSDGQMTFTSSGTLDGFGVFVTASDMIINSNLDIHGTIGTSLQTGEPATQMGIYAANDLMINGDANLTATIYSGGHTLLNGTANITGAAILNSVGDFNGTFNLSWAAPTEGLVTNFGGWRPVYGPVIAAWAEW